MVASTELISCANGLKFKSGAVTVYATLFINWFIGLLVYLHDQTGYTTNNYLVSCRISS